MAEIEEIADVEELVESLLSLRDKEVTLIASRFSDKEGEYIREQNPNCLRLNGKLLRVSPGKWEVIAPNGDFVRFTRECIVKIIISLNQIRIRW